MTHAFIGAATVAILAVGVASGDDASRPTSIVSLASGDVVREVAIDVTVGDLPLDRHWSAVFDAIFTFVDTNANGVIDEPEGRLVPSARAVRAALSSGFAPPVAAIRSVRDDLLGGRDTPCRPEDLHAYYRAHGVGSLTIASGALPNTAALTAALVAALDTDADGALTETEWSRAGDKLARFDANDDELVGVGELVPGATFPGRSADTVIPSSGGVDVTTHTGPPLHVSRRANGDPVPGSLEPSRDRWVIRVSDEQVAHTLGGDDVMRCAAWRVSGDPTARLDGLAATLESADGAMMMANEGDARGRRPANDRAWLVPVADRDGDGTVSPDETSAWLALQRKISRGHVLVSLHADGGLFDVVDRNHDGALSIRELREAWKALDTARCVRDDTVRMDHVPNQIFFVVSHGLPESLVETTSGGEEWFREMDRNSDGDVSRREFTGLPAAFRRLDRDADGLIAENEAAGGIEATDSAD